MLSIIYLLVQHIRSADLLHYTSSPQIIQSLNLGNIFITFEVVDEPTGKCSFQKARSLLHAEMLNLFDGRGRRRENEPKMKGAYRGF
jgi:hypothetical protein